MSEKHMFACELCNAKFTIKGNYYRHKKYLCSVKLAQEKKKSLDAQNETKLYYENIIEKLETESKATKEKLENELKVTKEKLENELKTTREKYEIELKAVNEKLMAVLEQDVTFMRDSQKKSAGTLDKSVDALTFLMTHRKNAPELKELTHEKAQDMLIRENRLYDYLMRHNEENTLDQYIGEIILKYIKKENPEEQSVWNSDVSRLTYLIRDIVDESPTWLRDPNGAMFNTKIIMPVINEITNYLYKCLHSKNPDKIALDNDSSDEESEGEQSNDTFDEREKMRRTGKILGTVETLKSKKYKKSLSEYIASRISLHKLDKNKSKKKPVKPVDSSDSDSETKKPKKVIKKKPVKPVDSSDSDSETKKPKKVIKKPVKPVDSSDSDSETKKPKKVIKKPVKPVDSSDSESETKKPKKVTGKKTKK
jgi:hypothetical protein